ncbi:hypothetical protein cyc_08591 [Cyclospora cayetanensis]|uniref:J domain-containing protein n=1 Tax=Cyclospora cayetanensis TaxID=88456 RepID=A0A1D3CYL2_9EIME|nr:hypothetical protein cyc_08591 [Cyclospora cayetanensis]
MGLDSLRRRFIDLYRVLGVHPTAADAEIKRKFVDAAKASHPDCGGDASRFQAVSEAYRILNTQRAAYDALYRARTGSDPSGLGKFPQSAFNRRHDTFDYGGEDWRSFLRMQQQRQEQEQYDWFDEGHSHEDEGSAKSGSGSKASRGGQKQRQWRFVDVFVVEEDGKKRTDSRSSSETRQKRGKDKEKHRSSPAAAAAAGATTATSASSGAPTADTRTAEAANAASAAASCAFFFETDDESDSEKKGDQQQQEQQQQVQRESDTQDRDDAEDFQFERQSSRQSSKQGSNENGSRRNSRRGISTASSDESNRTPIYTIASLPVSADWLPAMSLSRKGGNRIEPVLFLQHKAVKRWLDLFGDRRRQYGIFESGLLRFLASPAKPKRPPRRAAARPA